METTFLIIYFAALLVLAAFGTYGLVMVIYYIRLRPADPKPSKNVGASLYPHVTVQLPLFNELHVAERLVEAVCRLNYPMERLEIQILDDSTDSTTKVLANLTRRKRRVGFNIHHIHRTNRQGFKAGALKEGLVTATGEFIAIFDADFIPEPEFLNQTIPHLLADQQLGLVQARWEHINHDYSLLTRMQAMALDAHFAMEQQVRNRAECFINFNGTAGIWRKACILDAGNWESDTLTEDLDLSYRAQLRGWRFLYLNDVTVPAELPAEINGLKSQQFRWTKGAIETAKKHLWRVWLSRQPLHTKIHATVHLTANIVFPFILIVAILNVPMVFLKANNPELSGYFNLMSVFIFASISSFLFYLFAQRDIRADWRNRMLLFPVFMAGTMGLAVNNTKAVIEAIINHRSPFNRTPKYNIRRRGDRAWQRSKYRYSKVSAATVLEVLLAGYFIFGIVASLSFRELAAIPFQLMYLFGFGLTGFLSMRHAWVRKAG
ncbi:MAG: glycosyltransferase [Armatimonadetes bacterium]|nr:glycosyltransferase [Armatimonadota bacterium]